MRSEPTAAEKEAQSHLFEYLLSIRSPAQIIGRDISDRPDLAFVCQGKRIACECVQIPDYRILQWLHKRRVELISENGTVLCLTTIWPVEPHSWISSAIENKSHSVDEYRRQVAADEVWLDMHAHDENFMKSIFKEDTIPLMRVGATALEHAFDKVFFYDKRCGVQEIYYAGMPVHTKTIDLAQGYPAVTMIQYAGAAFQTTAIGEPPKTYEYYVEDTITMCVDPIDPTFRARGEPAVRIKPAKRIVITAYSDHADTNLFFDDGPESHH